MRLAVIAFLLFTLSAAAAPQARRTRPSAPRPQYSLAEDQKAIAELQQRDIEANIAVDTDRILALRTDDIVYLVPGRAPLVGQDAVRKYLEEIRQQLADWDMVAYEENWQEVQVVGDFAIQWGTVNIRAKKEGERAESAAVRNMMQVLRRQPDGSWKIARAIWNVQAPQQSPQDSEKAKPKD
jgi:uncharacterized protein (TIGR02246 family)